jgi:hypothetical protein
VCVCVCQQRVVNFLELLQCSTWSAISNIQRVQGVGISPLPPPPPPPAYLLPHPPPPL